LISLLGSGIIENNGTFLLKKLEDSVKDPFPRFGDLTGYECEVNHVHLEDYIDFSHNKDPEILFRSGVAFVSRLNEKLALTYHNEHFRIILSYSLDEPLGCSIRFHKIRTGENWIKMEDLEGYKSEAIMVMDVPAK